MRICMQRLKIILLSKLISNIVNTKKNNNNNNF